MRSAPAALRDRIARRRRLREEGRLRAAPLRRSGSETRLTLANLYGSLAAFPELEALADQTRRLSGGSLLLEPVHDWCPPADAHEEETVLRDLAGGRVAIGWAGARAVGALGYAGLDAFLAPFLLSSHTRQSEALASPAAAEALARLEELGLVGLALLPGALRRPLGITRPLLSASDWHGATVRTHPGRVAERTLAALGAIPALPSKAEWLARPAAEQGIDGTEIHLQAALSGSLSGTLAADVCLWPRLVLLAVSATVFDDLPSGQRDVLREAAARALEGRQQALARDDDAEAVPPRAALRVAHAGAGELALLRRAVEPVYEELRADPQAGPLLAQLEALSDPGQLRLPG